MRTTKEQRDKMLFTVQKQMFDYMNYLNKPSNSATIARYTDAIKLLIECLEKKITK